MWFLGSDGWNMSRGKDGSGDEQCFHFIIRVHPLKTHFQSFNTHSFTDSLTTCVLCNERGHGGWFWDWPTNTHTNTHKHKHTLCPTRQLLKQEPFGENTLSSDDGRLGSHLLIALSLPYLSLFAVAAVASNTWCFVLSCCFALSCL